VRNLEREIATITRQTGAAIAKVNPKDVVTPEVVRETLACQVPHGEGVEERVKRPGVCRGLVGRPSVGTSFSSSTGCRRQAVHHAGIWRVIAGSMTAALNVTRATRT